MPFHRLRRLVQGQGGSTLIELLVAMPIALLLLAAVLQSLGQAGVDQQDIEHRTETLNNGQIGLERMTRELRQADWIYFRSSSVIDLEVGVRATPTGNATPRFVRYDCSDETCVRYEGPPVVYPPPAIGNFTSSATLIGSPSSDVRARNGQLEAHDIFLPQKLDPTTGVRVPDYTTPDFIAIRIRLGDTRHDGSNLELQDGVALRNRTTFAA